MAPPHLRHRALKTVDLSFGHIVCCVLAVVLLTGCCLLAASSIGHFWTQAINKLMILVHLPAQIDSKTYLWNGWKIYTLPIIQLASKPISEFIWWSCVCGTLSILIFSLRVQVENIHWRFIFGVIGFIQATAIMFFSLFPDRFPYSLNGYLTILLKESLLLVMIIPGVFGALYYIFDFSLFQKIGLTVFCVGYFILLTPVLLVFHCFIIHHFSLLYLPLMMLLFSLPLQIQLFICWYSWGMSWPGAQPMNRAR